MKMKKILLNILIGLIVVCLVTIGYGMAQGAPNIKVSLATDKLVYLLDNPGTPAVDPDSLKMVLTFKNNGGTVITPIGFSERPFHLQLVFTGPDGETITANELTDTIKGDPEPPPVIPVNGQLLQAEPVDDKTLVNGWVLSITIPDAHAYYSLMKAGRYSAKARIPTRAYSCIDYTVDTISYSLIEKPRQGCSIWAGALESNTIYFSVIADADRDGYYYPDAYGIHAEADCDDTNPNVHPSAIEIPGNGIDDDCDSSTSDGGVVTQVSLLVPNGGDVLPSGGTYAIQWVAPSTTVKFDLQYSMNNGGTWTTIASKITGTSYNWTVPKPLNNKKNCLVKVIGYDASNVKVGEDTSDSTFTIEVIKVTSPNGQEIWKAGTTHAITWTTNGTKRLVKKVKLFYTYNGGANWILIYTILRDNPGSYNWRVPVASSASCKVKVVLKDRLGKTIGNDVSDEFFAIQP